jgi:hypothetical protein
MNAPLDFEDLAVGQTFENGKAIVEARAIKAYAAEFDPQPFHLDEDAARVSLFGRLEASGRHTAALATNRCDRNDSKHVILQDPRLSAIGATRRSGTTPDDGGVVRGEVGKPNRCSPSPEWIPGADDQAFGDGG